MALTTDKKARKNAPMDRGLLAYFPNALAGVAELSRIGNEQHNPGEEMHWARDKSSDHGDCIIRHQADWDQLDEDGMPHCAKVAWRALAQYEEYLIARGATPGRGTRASESAEPQVGKHYRATCYEEGMTWVGSLMEIDWECKEGLCYKVEHPVHGYVWANRVEAI